VSGLCPVPSISASGWRRCRAPGRVADCAGANLSVALTPPYARWSLGDRGRAPPDCLADLEAFELRMVDVERLVLARIPVGGAEFG
jgi:hypothetical protein